jgi:hypothetical protein
MRFRSAHTQSRNRLAYMATREHSPSDYLCQIAAVKQAPWKIGRLRFESGPDSYRPGISNE